MEPCSSNPCCSSQLYTLWKYLAFYTLVIRFKETSFSSSLSLTYAFVIIYCLNLFHSGPFLLSWVWGLPLLTAAVPEVDDPQCPPRTPGSTWRQSRWELSPSRWVCWVLVSSWPVAPLLIWLILRMEPKLAHDGMRVFMSSLICMARWLVQRITAPEERARACLAHSLTLFSSYRGGVFTPGAAFSRTKLIDRLHQHGIEFSVISSSEV